MEYGGRYMITDFGRVVRIYRMDNNISLSTMASTLQVPPSYLSALEMGRKNISEDFLLKLFSKYNFSEEEKTKLQEAAKSSGTTIKLNLTSSNKSQRELALQFARSFDSLSDDDISEISNFLNRRKQK